MPVNSPQNPQGYPVYGPEIDGTLTIRDLSGTNPVPPAPASGATFYPRGNTLALLDASGNSYNLADANPTGNNTPGALAETIPRALAVGTFTPTSGVLFIQEIFLSAGQSVGHIGFVAVGAAVTPTHWWAALLDATYKQQAHSADQTSGAINATTWELLAMVTPYVAPATGRYYLAGLINAGTEPTLAAASAAPQAAMVTGTGAPTPLLGGSSTTALTAPGTDGTTTYLAPTAAIAAPYMYAAA